MSSSFDTLQFHFPTHGDSILSKINALREEHLFCDITLILGDPRGATVQLLHFHGHRVILAASSDFLRDQFFLHEGRAELRAGVFSSVEIGKRLLLSCYTGLLEVPLGELVSFLTVASALRMSQVVEKCAQAVSQYLSPTLASLELERHSKEKEIQQLDSPRNQEKRDEAQPSKEREAGVIQSKLRAGQGAKLDSHRLRDVRDNRRVILAKTKLSEDAACCLKSEEGEDIQSVHTNKPSDKDDHITGAIGCKLYRPSALQDYTHSPNGGSSGQPPELEENSPQNSEEAGEEQKQEQEICFLAAQLQQCGELMDSNLFCLSAAHLPKSHCSEDELTEDSDSMLVQRPYLCRRCDRVFQHLESYVGHLREHRQYLCLVCGKGFSQKSNLTHHIRAHTGVKPFRCPLCHKTFSQKASLQDHLNLHTGDKPHKCYYCALHFAYKPGLRRHLKDVHGKSSLQNML